MTISLPTHHKAIDITAETCPMTFVRTRLALDELSPGQILLVRLIGADPLANVPRACADQGHDPLDLTQQPDGTWHLTVRKG
ncbi:MAG: sulfurtransferase TusA family protein [Acidocella sp.]|nr:sulfurtransferase TusA family protein [Acidocella sp.]